MNTYEYMIQFWKTLCRNARNPTEILKYYDNLSNQPDVWYEVLDAYEGICDVPHFPGSTISKRDIQEDWLRDGDSIRKQVERWENRSKPGKKAHNTQQQTFVLHALLFFTYLCDNWDRPIRRNVLALAFSIVDEEIEQKTIDSIFDGGNFEEHLAVILAALYHCLISDGIISDPVDCDRWYFDYLITSNIEPTIVRYIWDHLKKGVIDTNSEMFRSRNKYRAFNLANFYEVPVFTSNEITAGALLDSASALRVALRAPSGYGKSTYLAALLLSMTLESAKTLEIVSDPSEIEAFELLRKSLLPEKRMRFYKVLPIYVTGEMYNEYISRTGQQQPGSFEEVFVSCLPTAISEHEKKLLVDYIRARCRDGGVLFVCDAFDEVHASNRSYYISNFAAFNSPAYEFVDVIVSYRPIHDAFAFETQNHISAAWEIEPLKNWGHSKIQSFIQRYVDIFSVLGVSERKNLGQGLLEDLQSIPEYAPFLENPFLVSMFVFHSTRSDNQTANIYQMVWHIAHDLIARFKYTYGHDISSPHFERTDYNALLSKLAYSMCDKAEISHGDLIDTLSELDSDRKVNWSSIIGEDINSKAGILVPVRDEDGSRIQYQFQARNTIVPLLAAQAIFERLYERIGTLDFFELDESDQKKVFEKHLLYSLKSLSNESVAACTQYVVAALCNGIGRKCIDEFLATHGSIQCARTLMEKIDQVDSDACERILHSLQRLLDPEFAVTCFNNGTKEPECLATAAAILQLINA